MSLAREYREVYKGLPEWLKKAAALNPAGAYMYYVAATEAQEDAARPGVSPEWLREALESVAGDGLLSDIKRLEMLDFGEPTELTEEEIGELRDKVRADSVYAVGAGATPERYEKMVAFFDSLYGVSGNTYGATQKEIAEDTAKGIAYDLGLKIEAPDKKGPPAILWVVGAVAAFGAAVAYLRKK